MKASKIKLILGYIILNLILNPISVQGEPTQVIYPSADAFIGDMYPDFNTGDLKWLWICNDMNIVAGICYTLIYFVLPSNYNEYDTISLQFYIILTQSQSTLDVDVFRVIQTWNESTVNWNNRPSLGIFLFSRELRSGYSYDIDIKSHLISNTFSICILSLFFQYNLGQIPSKESSYGQNHIPTIVLSDSLLNNVLLGLMIGLTISGIAGLSVLGFYVYRRKTRNQD